ncbi:MAG TPA: metallophosphoesterase [Candidatus Eremiobacteraeota bacterium]|nr:MAG: putative metallophosphoesterase [bacterium ADurb.Bin363]HPZ10514.1 metallophosphoesterase [Candidatus Eremiobacteraeota bacterium]
MIPMIYFFAFILFLLLYIQFERSKSFEVIRDILYIPDLPEDMEDLKIIHLSDLHVSKYGKREIRIKEIVEEEKPHVIFITGDFVSNYRGITPCLKTMEGIKAPLGVWAVWGNNDNQLKTDRLKKGLSELDIQVLNNENRILRFRDSELRLIGVDDPHKKKDNLEEAMKDVSSCETTILLSHSPVIIHKASIKGIKVVLAGHTHGGQVRIPLLGAIYNHTWDLFRYSSGKFKVNSTQMYVTRGLGMSLIPIRFLCPAELTVFKLKRKK